MTVIKFNENDLNVEYFPQFIEKCEADGYLNQLQKLPFYTPTFRIRGQPVNPKRQVLAYGDSNTSYSFSGTHVKAEPWTPLMIELRRLVQDHVGCSFNYVLLNYYADGTNYISQHKDDESGLDKSCPIAVLSFGENRRLDFHRFNYPTTSIELQHGSLYTMKNPTNVFYTHGIPPDPALKNCRISLTFRKVLMESFPALKRPKLSIDESSMETHPPTPSKKIQRDPLENVDWLAKHYQSIDPPNPMLSRWDIHWNTFASILLEKNNTLRLHIRIFNECSNGELYPTKKGIVMTPSTFSDFETKLRNFQFNSTSNSFVANNQLFVACLDEDYCMMQQMFSTQSNDFFFKPNGLKLSKDQVLQLKDHLFNISECIIEGLFTKQLPNLILNQRPVCIQHYEMEKAESLFLSCVDKEIKMCINKLFQCSGCQDIRNSPFQHDCMILTMHEKFNSMRQSILLNANIFNIVKNISLLSCHCYYSFEFLSKMTIEFYDNHFEDVFKNQMY